MRSFLQLILVASVLLFLAACAEKKKERKQNFFSAVALSTIKNQVARIDTSLYSIRKIIYVDSLRSDTVYIRREDFKDAAKEFLSLPDLSDPVYLDRFKEDNTFDETLGRVLVVYTPVNVEKEVLQREEILVRPDTPEDKVTTIIVNTTASNKDSSIEKRLLWSVDASFQVTTIRQYPGKPEIISTYKVIWDEDTE